MRTCGCAIFLLIAIALNRYHASAQEYAVYLIGDAGKDTISGPALQMQDPKVLAEYEFISREPGSGTREITDAYFRAHKQVPENLKTQMELGSPEALKGVVATGLGFAILSLLAVEADTQLGRLVAIPLKPPLKRNIYVIHPQDRFQSRLTHTFIDFARSKLRELAP